MKLKVLLFSALVFLIQFSSSSFAYRYSYRGPKISSYGSTHSVRPYFRRNGIFVPGHRAANPHSGVHCLSAGKMIAASVIRVRSSLKTLAHEKERSRK